ncbi:MAG TPA: hypothetical protein VMN81_00540 [Vicinamibacterales bacterium]|nr:hypothetical protein [Vicinamibacterales bacterium]
MLAFDEAAGGRILLGGPKGMTAFEPAEVRANPYPRPQSQGQRQFVRARGKISRLRWRLEQAGARGETARAREAARELVAYLDRLVISGEAPRGGT